MYRRILLPLDLGEHGDVFDAALSLLEASGTLMLLHVIESVEGLGEGETEEFYAPLRARAEERLAAWAHDLEKRGAAVETELRTGKRGPVVVRYAIEERCDLIAIASRPADPERPGWGFGTTSHQVALMAPCSVLLVR